MDIYSEMKKYEPIARSLARNACHNCIWSEEDIYQDLMLKLFQTWDYINTCEDDPTGLVKKILKRQVVNIINYCKNRPDTSYYAKESNFQSEDSEEFNILDDVIHEISISEGSAFPDPEELVSLNELIDILKELRDSSDKDIREFLSSIIDDESRERIEYLNDIHLENAKRKVDRAYIPPFLRSKLLGKPLIFTYKVMFLVRDVLVRKGYDLPIAVMNMK